MTYTDLPSRQKSQRLLDKVKNSSSLNSENANSKLQQFNLYKQRAKNISNPNELLPGLNDISDAFEALPLDLIKYFTLLKEIDAKCINTIPQINHSIKRYIEDLHPPATPELKTNPRSAPSQSSNGPAVPNNSVKRLTSIKDKILEVIPCLEEKMHVTSVATDLLHKHMYRINNDYKLIIQNNEIPESIRIGPLNHPAMIMDSSSPNDLNNANRSLQLARSESRREALAARKANKDEVDDEDSASGTNNGKANNNNSTAGNTGNLSKKKKGPKENTPDSKNLGSNATASTASKKRPRKEQATNSSQLGLQAQQGEEISRPGTPGGNKKRNTKPKKEDIFVNVTPSNSSNNSTNSNSNNNNNNNNSNSTSTANPHQPNHPSHSGSQVGNPNNPPSSSNNIEPTYCYCNQVSFGEMVGCDGDDCKREWFHLPCIGFKNPPKGKWYCDDCIVKMKKVRKI